MRILAYDEVTPDYARDGGEGDRSLATWRDIYWRYIVSECGRIGREPSPKAPLVMERFRVVYRADPALRPRARGRAALADRGELSEEAKKESA